MRLSFQIHKIKFIKSEKKTHTREKGDTVKQFMVSTCSNNRVHGSHYTMENNTLFAF